MAKAHFAFGKVSKKGQKDKQPIAWQEASMEGPL
jgi:hypothetical protein